MTEDYSEAVPTTTLYAPWWIRLAATVIDLCVVLVPLGAASLLTRAADHGAGALVGIIGATVLYLYLVAFEAIKGQTLGKMALRLHVIREEGGRIGWGQALVRNLFKLFALGSLILALVTLFWILFSKRSQRVGDYVSRTIVVEVLPSRRPRSRPAPEPSSGVRVATSPEGGVSQPSESMPAAPAPPEHVVIAADAAPPQRGGVTGFVLSLVGFLLPLLWPFALYFSWRDLRRESRSGQQHGLSAAGLVISAVGTALLCTAAVLMVAGVPQAWWAALTDTPQESRTKEGVAAIQAGIEAWAADHSNLYPTESVVNADTLAEYVSPWPENPYTLRPMKLREAEGDCTYWTNGLKYELTGYGPGAEPIIVLP